MDPSDNRSTRHLNQTQFYKSYTQEIDNLYLVVLHNLSLNDIVILNENKFYSDFVKYIYKHSYKFKSDYDRHTGSSDFMSLPNDQQQQHHINVEIHPLQAPQKNSKY